MKFQFVNRYRTFKNKYIVQERRKHEYFLNRFYAHIIDPFFTKLFYDLRMTPNMVTVISGIIGLLSAVAIGTHHGIIGGVLLQFHHLIDGADGNLARLTNRCTDFGAKLDQWTDQVVRLALFVTIAVVADVHLWVKILFLCTIYLDLLIVHVYVLPFMRKNDIIRSKWKKWFLSKGIIPAFDIFLIYFLISIFSIFNRLDILVTVVIIGKNLDWIYRVWECWKTKLIISRFK